VAAFTSGTHVEVRRRMIGRVLASGGRCGGAAGVVSRGKSSWPQLGMGGGGGVHVSEVSGQRRGEHEDQERRLQ
jgi:hypothetical protein